MPGIQDRRRARELRDFRVPKNDVDSEPKESFTFEQSIGCGPTLTICGISVTIHPCPMRLLKVMSNKLNTFPTPMLAQAMLNESDAEDIVKVTEKINFLLGHTIDNELAYTPDEIPIIVAAQQNQLDEDQYKSMIDTAVEVLILGNTLDENTISLLKKNITVIEVTDIARAFFSVNSGLKRRF